MNIEQAKSIPLESFLENLGYQPARQQRGQIWYLSPLRQEKTPSFKVNTALNLWFDFGSGEGGTIIDLAMALGQSSSVPEALKLIESMMQGVVLRFEPRAPKNDLEPESKPEILSVGGLRNPDLKRYLSQRGISLRKCCSELREVHYKAGDKDYVAIGFPSDRGGNELRSRTFKGSLGAKSISTRTGETSSALVFEGFFDYLTYITLWGKPGSQVLVLNSVSFREPAIEQLRALPVTRVELFRDNDDAGEALLGYFREQMPTVEIIDKAAEIYPKNKDLNDWHQANRRQSFDRAV
jgi:hypothetical protein